MSFKLAECISLQTSVSHTLRTNPSPTKPPLIHTCLQTSDNTPFTPLCNLLTLSRPSPIANTPSISPLTSHPHPVPYKTQAGHSITALLGTCWATLRSWWLHYRSLQAATKTNMAVILWSNIHTDWMQVNYVPKGTCRCLNKCSASLKKQNKQLERCLNDNKQLHLYKTNYVYN